MAQITKKVDMNVYPTQRSQTFTQADAGAGDIILVQTSLGKPARILSIEAASTMTIRLNVLRTVYPARTQADGLVLPGVSPELPNLTKGVEVEDVTGALVTISANETFTLDNDMPVYDVKIVSAAGNYEMFVA
jgi:hypothetical protein